eukprot:g8375.t1
MVFAVLYTLLTLMYLFNWEKIAVSAAQTVDHPINVDADTQKRRNFYVGKNRKFYLKEETGSKTQTLVEKFFQFRKMFNINGVLFLWKLYLFEFIESINQLVNFLTVYLCAFETPITICICVLLSTDAFYRAYQVRQPNTVARRDRQVKIDICFDFLCVAAPLCTLWFAYGIPISIPEMIQITAWATLCLFSKLRSILREIIRVRTGNAILREQTNLSLKAKRNRKSIFRTLMNAKISKKQQERVPKIVSTVFCVYNVGYGLFFLVMAVVHLGMFLNKENFIDCDKTTWSKGCKIKIPFCKSLFTPTCNCVSLKIENDYKLVALPNSLVDEMTGLRKVFIRNCNLTKLPPRMEQLTEMVDFEISFNRLEEFMVDVLKWKKMKKLHLMYNNISNYNEEAVWTHPELDGLGLASNNIKMPARLYLPSLTFLHLGDNNMTINKYFDANSLPNVAFLYLNGNNLRSFPSESLKDNLVDLGIARCKLKSLPPYLSKYKYLKYLDARDNYIINVDDDIIELFRTNHVESYFSGNAVCMKDGSLDCEPLCSKTCWSRKVRNNGECDLTCNSKECHYDGGDCQYKFLRD